MLEMKSCYCIKLFNNKQEDLKETKFSIQHCFNTTVNNPALVVHRFSTHVVQMIVHLGCPCKAAL